MDPDHVDSGRRDLIIVSTDESKGYLREMAIRENMLSFVVPANVGGRFSVLSSVGLISAAFTG